MKKLLVFLVLFLNALILSTSVYASVQSHFSPIQIVAAESFYGDVASQLGKPYVEVISIMNNPKQDPHMFNANPKIIVSMEKAQIIVENGLGYDNWMQHLYSATSKKAFLINVGQLMHKKSGVNPHIWYDPQTMPIYAQTLTKKLIACDPQHEKHYKKNLTFLLKKAHAYQKKIFQAQKKLKGMSVTATEPILGYLISALKLKMLNTAFQQSVMNGADLTPREIIEFEQSLTEKKVKLFIYNAQVTDPTATHLKNLALKNDIPIIGVSETMPANQHYYQWMDVTLNKILIHIERP